MTQPPSGEWVCFNTELTNSSGRVSYVIPESKKLPVGVYPVKMVVRYEKSLLFHIKKRKLVLFGLLDQLQEGATALNNRRRKLRGSGGKVDNRRGDNMLKSGSRPYTNQSMSGRCSPCRWWRQAADYVSCWGHSQPIFSWLCQEHTPMLQSTTSKSCFYKHENRFRVLQQIPQTTTFGLWWHP